eukprot:CAMPEP_0195524514 /NCGR_PEP_ID=MMETSP0794_2-20130614/24404_1 /TAXON_ID=515487 /ORGANISM="Stephanopyxis turris, Strain CCMP 815" /LENGTH=121 /DNA_ID=CAMNT_0040654757 /DNA_START=131 /DNA_END=493 /DNA_ORIENTATION=+
MVLGLGKIRGLFGGGGNTSNDGDATLPPYFPVRPKGCETQSDALFQCITNTATDRLRAIEDEKEQQVSGSKEEEAPPLSTKGDTASEASVAVVVNPLDSCREMIYTYKRCCDKNLKKKQNW